MLFPEKIKVGPLWYTIVHDHKFVERTDAWGQHMDGSCIIRLTNKDNGNDATEAFYAVVQMHELLHAIERVYLPPKLHLKEDQINAIAKGLVQVVRDSRIDLLDEEHGPDSLMEKQVG